MKSTDLIGHIKFRSAKGVACKTNPGSGHNNNLVELVQVDLRLSRAYTLPEIFTENMENMEKMCFYNGMETLLLHFRSFS